MATEVEKAEERVIEMTERWNEIQRETTGDLVRAFLNWGRAVIRATVRDELAKGGK